MRLLLQPFGLKLMQSTDTSSREKGSLSQPSETATSRSSEEGSKN
jgi:hypothetical protein